MIELDDLEKLSPSRQYTWLKVSLGLLVLASLMASVFAVYWIEKHNLRELLTRDLSAITEHKPRDNTLVFDKHGHEIGEFFTNYYIFTPYEKIPKPMIAAVIAIEDRRFFEHPGYDWRAILRAFISYLRPDVIDQGASTITQQVVRNFLLTPEKTILRKVKEILLAIRLENQLTKQEILEIYLNDLFLGYGAYGVGAAAKRYFDKDIT